MENIYTPEEVIKEVADEAINLYNNYPYLNIWDSIRMAENIVRLKHKGGIEVEINP